MNSSQAVRMWSVFAVMLWIIAMSREINIFMSENVERCLQVYTEDCVVHVLVFREALERFLDAISGVVASALLLWATLQERPRYYVICVLIELGRWRLRPVTLGAFTAASALNIAFGMYMLYEIGLNDG